MLSRTSSIRKERSQPDTGAETASMEYAVFNLSRTLEGNIVRHYDRFIEQQLTISLVEQHGEAEDFVFSVSSSRKGHSPYRVNVWRQFHACPFALDGFGPCSKHGDVVGFCPCQANVEKHLMCKHLAAAYIEAQRILAHQGKNIRPIDLHYWHPEPAPGSTAPVEPDSWELAESA